MAKYRPPLTEEQRIKARAATRRWKKRNPKKVADSQRRFIQRNREALNATVEAWKKMDADCTTSEERHPGYILVPLDAFEEMRTALAHHVALTTPK